MYDMQRMSVADVRYVAVPLCVFVQLLAVFFFFVYFSFGFIKYIGKDSFRSVSLESFENPPLRMVSTRAYTTSPRQLLLLSPCLCVCIAFFVMFAA